MRVEIWFDFNKTSLEVINNLDNAFKRFKYASDCDVLFRSLPQSEAHFKYHELFQYGRKKGLKHNYLCAIFNIYKNNLELMTSLDSQIGHFGLDINDVKNNLLNHGSLRVVKNQLEHASLQKITIAPTLTFTHGFRLAGLVSVNDIEETLIQMYEKDSGIKYCIDDDCER